MRYRRGSSSRANKAPSPSFPHKSHARTTTDSTVMGVHQPLDSSQICQPRPRQNPPPHRMNSSQRSEEHTSELQSRQYLVCRLLLEKKNIHVTATLLEIIRANLLHIRSKEPDNATITAIETH